MPAEVEKKVNVDPWAKPWHTEATRGRCEAVSATGYTVFRGDLDVSSKPVEDAVRCVNACADFVNPAALPEIVVFLRMLNDPSDGDPTEWPMTTATLLAKLDTPADTEGGG